VFFELTELLSCPLCGPEHGLVLIVEEIEDRRVDVGRLGCPNCKREYPVARGLADLRLQAGPSLSEEDQTAGPESPLQDEELALKVAALSGLTEGPGYLLVAERLAIAAEELAELLPGFEIIAFRASPAAADETAGVSHVVSDVRFPLMRYRLRAVAIAPAGDPEMVTAAADLVALGGRLILLDASDEDLAAVEATGLSVLARQERMAVARR
jgi:uncharacterized protein YbaR (Trm112 family)